MNRIQSITSHILYSNIYENKQLLVSDADSLTFIAQSSEGCVRCILNSFCYIVWFNEQSAP